MNNYSEKEFLDKEYYEKIRFLEKEIEYYKPVLKWKYIKPDKRMLKIKREYEEKIKQEEKREKAKEYIQEKVERFDKLKSKFENILERFWI